MTNLPDDDLIDPVETRLVRRVRSLTEPAVVPIDPVAIASAAVHAGRRPTLGSRLFGARRGAGTTARLVLLGAGAILAVAGLGVVITVGSRGLVAPQPTPTAEPVGLRSCTPDDVDAVITGWDGAAGHRIATVQLHQVGSSACGVDPLPQVWLAAGHGDKLIVGKPGTGGPAITFQPGGVLYTLVQAGNYCGPDPEAPVTVVFVQGSGAFVATALTPTDLSGVPPCLGTAGPTDDITMHPWSAQPPS
jgi:Protein of unknown function (DUF4232)